MSAGVLFVASALLLGLAAAFAAGEATLAALGRRRLLQLGRQDPGLRRALERPQELGHALQLGSSLAKVGAVAAATVLAERTGGALGAPVGLPAFLGMAVMAFLVLVLAEFVPRLAVSAAPESWTPVVSPLLRGAHAMLGPVVRILAPREVRAGSLPPPAGAEGPPLDEGGALPPGGVVPDIEPRERAMLQGAFRIRSVPVRDVMTPLPRLVMAEAPTPVDELIALVRSNWHSRLPIYEGRRENVRGVVYAKDLLPFTINGDPQVTARALMREAFFVPPTKTAEELLRDFQREHVHVALVVDEYGSALGLVTLEDVIEQIVGEVRDEFDVEEPAWKRLEDGALLVRGDASLAEVQRQLGIEPAPAGAETVESFLLKLRPQGLARGEEVQVEGLARFRVERTAGRRIWTVRAEREEALR